MPEDSIFCKIRDGQIPTPKLFENDKVFAVNDINPVAPTHILIIPKLSKANFDSYSINELDIITSMFEAAKQIINEKKLDNGYRLVINCGKNGGQTVDHLHMHLLAGREFSWPPG
jgi:histidine triad (HIT) family protein